MTESKFRKVATALIVGAIVLITLLVSMLIYQLVSFFPLVQKKNELLAEIVKLEKMIDENEDEEAIRQTKAWIEQEARELGYYYEGDIIIIDGKEYDVLG